MERTREIFVIKIQYKLMKKKKKSKKKNQKKKNNKNNVNKKLNIFYNILEEEMYRFCFCFSFLAKLFGS